MPTVAHFRHSLAAIACAGLAVAVAVGVPQVHAQSASPQVAASRPRRAAGPVEALMIGLGHSMQTAAQALDTDGQRSRATRALDDARRVARVLRDAMPHGDAVGALGIDAVNEARHALQNGNPQAASHRLRVGSQQLLGGQVARSTTPPLDGSAASKLVINARGQRVGRLDRLVEDGHGKRQAVLKVGGMIDLLGFIDANNRLVVVPADSLVEGKRMVALTSDITPQQAVALPLWRSTQ